MELYQTHCFHKFSTWYLVKAILYAGELMHCFSLQPSLCDCNSQFSANPFRFCVICIGCQAKITVVVDRLHEAHHNRIIFQSLRDFNADSAIRNDINNLSHPPAWQEHFWTNIDKALLGWGETIPQTDAFRFPWCSALENVPSSDLSWKCSIFHLRVPFLDLSKTRKCWE